jgi:hypothetical protein
VSGVSILPLSTILIFPFGIVPTVWYFVFFILLSPPQYVLIVIVVADLFLDKIKSKYFQIIRKNNSLQPNVTISLILYAGNSGISQTLCNANV